MPAGSPADRTAVQLNHFQYSIGDARRRLSGRFGGSCGATFNTPLEMRASPAGAQGARLATEAFNTPLEMLEPEWARKVMSRITFNTPLEMRSHSSTVHSPGPLYFQYSIGDAPPALSRKLCVLSYFQYSIGDADKNRKYRAGAIDNLSILHWRCVYSVANVWIYDKYTFNTPLEMQIQVTLFELFRIHIAFNTPLEMQRLCLHAKEYYERFGFQYSIGDASDGEWPNTRCGSWSLSILHWRCQTLYVSALPLPLLLLFQYSIGDANRSSC